MKKIIVSILIFSQLIMVFSSCFAVDTGDVEPIYTTKKIDDVKMNYYGQDMIPYYTVYKENEIEYPVYCLNYEYAGVTEDKTYSVSVTGDYLNSGTSKNVLGVWRAIINGYPFKTAEELNCANDYEAYAATKQAVWCMLYDNREFKYFSYTGEEGKRVYNSMVNIVTAAKSSSQTQFTTDLDMDEGKWQIDNENKLLIKNIKIIGNVPMYDFKFSIVGDAPENIEIVDLSKSGFEKNKEIQIRIPMSSLDDKEKFELHIETQIPSTDMYYGKAPGDRMQNYVLTSGKKATIAKYVRYNENNTGLEIEKQDAEGNFLEGVKFTISDENENILYENLETDEFGKIKIEHILPGKYYIQEVETIDGYILNSEVIEVNIEFNENKNVNVLNEKIQDVPDPEPEPEPKIEVPKLPRTGF